MKPLFALTLFFDRFLTFLFPSILTNSVIAVITKTMSAARDGTYISQYQHPIL
jgi:hypothetical protein